MQKAYRATASAENLTADDGAVVWGVKFTTQMSVAFARESKLHLLNQRCVYHYRGELWDVAKLNTAIKQYGQQADDMMVARLQVLKGILLYHDTAPNDLKGQVKRLLETQLLLSQAYEPDRRAAAASLALVDDVFSAAVFAGKLDKPANRVIVANIPDSSQLLQLGVALNEQPKVVFDCLRSEGIYSTTMTGRDLYVALSRTDLAPPAKVTTYSNLQDANEAFLQAQADHASHNPTRMSLSPSLTSTHTDGVPYKLKHCEFLSRHSDSFKDKRAAASRYLAEIGIKGVVSEPIGHAMDVTLFDPADAQVIRVLTGDPEHTTKIQPEAVTPHTFNPTTGPTP